MKRKKSDNLVSNSVIEILNNKPLHTIFSGIIYLGIIKNRQQIKFIQWKIHVSCDDDIFEVYRNFDTGHSVKHD